MLTNLLIRATNQRLLANGANYLASQQTSLKFNPSRSLADSSSSSVPSKKTSSPLTEQSDSKELDEFRGPQRGSLYPDQMEWLDERQVRISKPSKNVMQSGTAYMNSWKIEFDSKERWEYWLMGWTSSRDPVSNLTMNFPTKEAAIAFCEKNKLQWYVEDQPERKLRKKSYAENFAYKRRTRLGNK